MALSRLGKAKKVVSEHKKQILSHHQRKPSRADRADFPRQVVAELIREADGQCQCGCGRPDDTTHHVMPRGRDGRGVKTNGMRLNGLCHDRIQTDEERLQHWISVWERKYGPYFWYDEEDWQRHNWRLAAEQEKAEAERLLYVKIQSAVNVIVSSTGRELAKREAVLLAGLSGSDLAVLVNLLKDVAGGMPVTKCID